MLRILALLIFLTPFLHAFDPYDAIDSLLKSERFPRRANTVDKGGDVTSPLPLFSPEGDFNGDGRLDVAISGIYDKKLGSKNYFLLIASTHKKSGRYQRLYFREFSKLPYLHKPGTTGEGDPGDQAFSLTFCTGCEEGFDYYWAPSRNTFRTEAWKRKTKQVTVPVKQEPSISDEDIEKALKVVGVQPEVQKFVKELKDRKGSLATRVEEHKKEKTIFWVLILEKKEGGEALFGKYLVDTKKEKILKTKINEKK